MKFGKNLIQVVDLSNPEWGQYWINYKYLKRKINEIIEHRSPDQPVVHSSDPKEIAKNAAEVEFFILIRKELKKTSEFFKRCQEEFTIRWERVWESYLMLQEKGVVHDKNTWTRLLMACVRFYKDVLLLENFAIMNYCGFSKILKKHDKVTGYITRDAFMRNVMNHQNITHYPIVLELIRKSEQLFHSIQTMDSVMPLQDDERLFIDAIRDMNYQASRMQAEESQESHPHAPLPPSVPPSQSTDVSAKSSPASSSEPVVVVVQEDQHTHGTVLPTSVASSSSPSTLIHEPIDPAPVASSSSLSTSTTVSPPQSVVPTAVTTTMNTASHVASINTTNSTSTQQLSDRLDHATMLAVEAAMRLNCHNAPPDVPLALSWMHRVAGNKVEAKRDAAVAPNGTPATGASQPPKGHVPTSSSTSPSLEAPAPASLRRPLSAVDDPSASDAAGSHPDVHPDPKRLRTI